MRRTLTFFLFFVLLVVSTTALAAVKSNRDAVKNEVLVETDNEIQTITEDGTIYAKCDIMKFYDFKGKKPGAKPERFTMLGILLESPNPVFVRGMKIGIEQKASPIRRVLMRKPEMPSTTITYTSEEVKNQKLVGNGKVYYITATIPNNYFEAMAAGNYTVKDILKKKKTYTFDFDILDGTGKNITGKYIVNEAIAKDISYVTTHDIYNDPAWMNKIPGFY